MLQVITLEKNLDIHFKVEASVRSDCRLDSYEAFLLVNTSIGIT